MGVVYSCRNPVLKQNFESLISRAVNEIENLIPFLPNPSHYIKLYWKFEMDIYSFHWFLESHAQSVKS
jgi:hypothetical protein